MKQQIAGKEIDVLTREELRSELRSIVEFYVSGYLRPPDQARPEGGAILSAGGVSVTPHAEIYVVDPGMIFRLTRLYVTVGSSTFAAPYAGSGGISIYRGMGNVSEEIDGLPFTSLPQVGTWAKSNGPYIRDGESLRVGITGGPANGQLYVRAAGFLDSIGFDRETEKDIDL